ncbi:VOC family protein [Modestobacter sp. Leaf380]|uniref:VOC family protein n=1 Tax=Modestobacter sp. Leaf380 TaxID=1736356 RepID=UPI0006F775C1|nr:VOC family protein [Modestobacter sp. Leaf380]KQS71529.1 3-demethylubiquinone-9 3-methyltransferase [Modestobacter sp. Leaf380]
MTEIVPCLWFTDDAEAAVALYTGLFPDSEVLEVTRYPAGAPGEEGSVLTVEFTVAGSRYTALNGGPHDAFNDAVSLQVLVADQAELDRVWDGLLAGGGTPVQCGWLKDRFGVSWQVVPRSWAAALRTATPAQAAAGFAALMPMVRIDVSALEAALRS